MLYGHNQYAVRTQSICRICGDDELVSDVVARVNSAQERLPSAQPPKPNILKTMMPNCHEERKLPPGLRKANQISQAPNANVWVYNYNAMRLRSILEDLNVGFRQDQVEMLRKRFPATVFNAL